MSEAQPVPRYEWGRRVEKGMLMVPCGVDAPCARWWVAVPTRAEESPPFFVVENLEVVGGTPNTKKKYVQSCHEWQRQSSRGNVTINP